MGKRIPFLLLLIFLVSAGRPPEALALDARVKTIHADGTLELDSGQRVSFLGIRLTPEGVRFLKVLVAGREVFIEEDPYVRSSSLFDAEEPTPVYMFVETTMMNLPYDPTSLPREKRVMINRILVSMGAARVEEDQWFKAKEDFLQAQEEAREKGEGIWSYATLEDMLKADPLRASRPSEDGTSGDPAATKEQAAASRPAAGSDFNL